MPVETSYDAERRRLTARIHGEVSMKDILASLAGLLQSPEFEPRFDLLTDHRERKEVIDVDEVETLAGLLERVWDRLEIRRWALVTRKAATYGMARTLAVRLEHLPIEARAFYGLEEAEAWLATSAPA